MSKASTKLAFGLVLAFTATIACGTTAIPDDPPAPLTDCGATLKLCAGRCVDPRFDRANCGDCAIACGPDRFCVNGVCNVACVGGTKVCGALCVDTRYDPSNCGFCGNACAYGVACFGGACAKGCGSKQTSCSSGCKDTTSDDENCGACALTCTGGAKCTNGVCVCSATLCGSTCADLQSDANHCGSCTTACAATLEVCSVGKCVCAGGLTSCSGACVDTRVSPKNCGSCGKTCEATEICDAGVCTNPTTDWPTQGGNPLRDGVVLGEVGRPPLQHIWSVSPVGSSVGIQPIAVGGNRVYLTSTYSPPVSTIRALDLSDGSLVWSRPMGNLANAGFPSYSGGRVYVVNGQGFDNTPSSVLALDANSGNIVWNTGISSQFQSFWSPLIVGGVLHTNAGYTSGLQGFDLTQGNSIYFFSPLVQVDQWSATWSGSEVLTYLNHRLRAHSPTTGAVNWSTLVNVSSFASVAYPVVGTGHAYVIDDSQLYAVNLTTHVVDWIGYGSYRGIPAVNGGSVYAFSSGTLVVRDAATGALQWYFIGDGALSGTVVIANDFVYVASETNTYAVDRATHQQVWTTPVGGALAIASRRLLVSSKATLHAFRMAK